MLKEGNWKAALIFWFSPWRLIRGQKASDGVARRLCSTEGQLRSGQWIQKKGESRKVSRKAASSDGGRMDD